MVVTGKRRRCPRFMVQVALWGVVGVLTAITSARADIYRYVDSDGVAHFSNIPTSDSFEFYVSEPKMQQDSGAASAVEGMASLPIDRPTKFDAFIYEASERYGIPASLIKAIIKVESDFVPNAVSRAGACGLMQIMPLTAQELGLADVFDPRENILGGARYLKRMLSEFGNDLTLALAAYNAGPTRVAAINDVPRIKETQDYVVKVLKCYDGR